MPCNCGGSTPRPRADQARPLRQRPARQRTQLASPPRAREGGPGTPGYYSGYPKKPAG